MISFRKMKKSDIEMVIKWIREDHVLEYWVSAQNVSDEMLYKKYNERLIKDDIETFIISIKSTPIGLIQTYFMDSFNPYNILDISSKGIDLFIGEREFVNKGYGTRVIIEFLKLWVFSNPDIQYACIDPEVANERAIHVYKKVGFQIHHIGYDEDSKLLTCYMLLKREDFFDYML